MKYWTQEQAPNGGWVDRLGTNNLEVAKDYARYLQEMGTMARVVERDDKVIQTFTA